MSGPVIFTLVLGASQLLFAALYVATEKPAPAIFHGIVAGLSLIAFFVILLIRNHHERKTNGRHRKAAEAHRARADRGAGDRAGRRSGRGARAGTGAGMTDPYEQLRKELDQQMRSTGLLGNAHVSGLVHIDASGNLVLGGSAGGASPAQPKPRPNKQPNAGDFEGVGYAAGVVTGTRSFELDKLGRLTGVAYKAVWKPGENEARCMTRDVDMAGFYSYYGRSRYAERVRVADRPAHSIADCEHGFYGYYDGSNDYYEPGRIMAVVEGYGDTIIGTRGFRASKARIVALHLPGGLGVRERRLVARNYPGIPTFESFDAMVAEFPPDDAGRGINPESDPTFWTREA